MIDLRSDLCAAPTREMWEAMQRGPLGLATFGDDDAVGQLEARGAELLAKEAAVFVPTCTMANLAVLLTLGGAGRAVVLEASSHILANEGDGISALAGLAPVPVTGTAGRLDPAAAGAAIEQSGATLLCLENTHTRAGGTVLDAQATGALAAAARRHGASVHLDGARLTNAAIALGVPLSALAAPVDTVAVSLNKGLCAPFGTILAGPSATIAETRTHLKRLGGGSVHKAGIAAAACLVALDTMIERLAEDHARARELGRLLAAEGLIVDPPLVETNILYTTLGDHAAPALELLAARDVLALSLDGRRVRFVTHRGIDDRAVARAAQAIAEVGLAVSTR